MKFETKAIKSTLSKQTDNKPVSAPIYLSTTFLRNEDGGYTNDFQYTRGNNPNRKMLEESIASLENGKSAFAFASGMAAISAVFQSLKSGDHILIADDVYYAIRQLLSDVFEPWGLTYDYVDMTNLELVAESVKDNTALIWCETPSNPLLKITDIHALSKIAKKSHALLAVDNTWSTPVLQNPIDLGADIVMHSTTKYFGGHSDVLGGCIVLKKDEILSERLKQIQKLSGAVPSPFDCWLIARGIQTLHLRVTHQSKSAMALAAYLEKHEQIEQVFYPGLESHPNHDIAKSQMNNGYGGMLSVLIRGSESETFALSKQFNLFATATSLGGVESLIEHRKSVEGEHSATPGNLLRVSVGLEHIDDLINDWVHVLENIR